MKILIAGGDVTEQLPYVNELQQQDHQVIQVKTGQELIAIFFVENPDLVFLDTSSSGMPSTEVVSAIKNGASRWVPIIFLVSANDIHHLAHYIDSDGDDFLVKPIEPLMITAKVKVFEKIANVYEKTEKQNQEIQFYNQRLIQEQEAAKKVFNNIAHRGCLSADNVNYHLSPVSIFNGDLMLAIETPMGGMRFMLADFTGHGLPAAIGAIPASEIFYGMSKKGFSINDVLIEMNARLHSILPRGVFCCVVMVDLDVANQQITFVNAGSPQSYLIDLEANAVEEIHSKHLPLGVLSPGKFSVQSQVFHFGPQHKLLTFTDGVTESSNKNEEFYGDERVLAYIKSHLDEENLCKGLVEHVIAFTDSSEQGDDLSILEILFPKQAIQSKVETDKSVIHALTGTLDSNMHLCLRGQSLAKFDPVPMVLQALLECRELTPFRSDIFTIVSEIYNNALEHGVLGLNSDLKKSRDGFADYYNMRSEKLDQLNNGFINIEFDHRPVIDGGVIVFDFIDSGSGFDFESILASANQKSKHSEYSGRGLKLLNNLCDSVEYFDGGHHIKATYRWNLHGKKD